VILVLLVGGGYNTASEIASTISGGSHNTASSSKSTVSGGHGNTASNSYSTVSGGYGNTASGEGSTVSGGLGNIANGDLSTVGGGGGNTASGDFSIVDGGSGNTASGDYSTVGGGSGNTASGNYSRVLGGYSNTANGFFNLVFGYDVDPTVTEDFRVYFFDGGHPGMLAINREDADHPIHVGTDGTNGNGAYLTAGGTWTSTSSITKKDRFEGLSDEFILSSIMTLPVERWFYKQTEERHIGPFAEDFHRVFGTGELNNPKVDKSLSSMDVAGVSLRAVQALMNKIEALETENSELRDQLKNEIETLKKEIEKLKK
jgi:trimeric autotransporter adhesin